MKEIKLCSLFSGIGAFEKALKALDIDFEITSYCEIEKHSACAYAAIHGVSESLNLGDISKVKSKDIPEFNLMTWGFPCQDISIAGDEAGIKVGTRSGLYFEGYRILKDRLPKYSIIENVKNLTQKGHIDELNMILNDLEGLGYKNYWKVLNAKDFGVPQNRERVFIVSILGEGDFEFPKGFDNGVRLKDVLENEVEEKYYIDNERVDKLLSSIGDKEISNKTVYEERSDEGLRLFKDNVCGSLRAKDAGGFKGIIEPIRLGGLFDDAKSKHQAGSVWEKETIAPTLDTMQGGYRQPSIIIGGTQKNQAIKKDGICTCLTSSMGTGGGYVPMHNYTTDFRIRKLTPLECWRLMGFTNEDFFKAKAALLVKFYKGKDRANSQLYKMAGNSIVVDVLVALLSVLFGVGISTELIEPVEDIIAETFRQGELF